MTGTIPGLAAATASLPTGGRLVVIGLHERPREVDLRHITLAEQEIIGTNAHSCTTDLPEALRMLARRRDWRDIAPLALSLDRLVDDGIVPLVEGRSERIKTLVDPWAAQTPRHCHDRSGRPERLVRHSEEESPMSTFPTASLPAPGPMAVDWEDRFDPNRLREYRLSRARAALEASDLGAVLLFDMNNIRYVTSTTIGEWARDKLMRWALLTRTGGPYLWDFGSAARKNRIHAPWLEDDEIFGGMNGLRGAVRPQAGLFKRTTASVVDVLRKDGVAGHAARRGRHRAADARRARRGRASTSATASRRCSTRARSSRATRSSS